MTKGIIFIACFFVAFNLAFFAGVHFGHHEDMIVKESSFIDPVIEKKIEKEIQEIKKRKTKRAESIEIESKETMVKAPSELNQVDTEPVLNTQQQKVVKLDIPLQEVKESVVKQSAKKASSYEELYKKWNRPREVLGSLTNIIKVYSETEGLESSSKQLFNDMSAYSKKLNKEVKDLAKDAEANVQGISHQEAQETLKGKKIYLSPFKARDMYINLLKSYYGGLQNQHVFMNSVNQNRVADPDADNFIVDGNKIVAENETYQDVKKIADKILKMFPQDVEE